MKRLATWLGREPLAVADVVGWVLRLAKGMALLHEIGEPHGRLSALAIQSAGRSAGSKAQLLTPEEVARDFTYFSAERARGSGPSLPDDVWALGVILYFGLTRTFPFPGDGRIAVAERIEWRPASPIAVYGVDHAPLQILIDWLFRAESAERLTMVRVLIEALVAIEPDAADLPALELDRPTAAGEAARPAAAPPRLPPPAATPKVAGQRRASAGTAAADDVEPTAPDAVEAEPFAPLASAAADAPTPAASPTGQAAAAPAPRSARPRRRSSLLRAGVMVPLAALTAIAVYYVVLPRLRSPKLGSAPTTAPAAPAAAVSAPPSTSAKRPEPAAVSAAGTATAASSSDPSSAAPTAGASASAASPQPGDRVHCVSQLFPPETFSASRPSLYFLCSEPDPRKGADAVGTEIVLGKGHRAVTPAMREWDQLGWFQMAMFAVVRATCCESAAPLQSRLAEAPCKFDGALMALGEAVVHGGEGERASAVDGYLEAIQCVVDSHYANAFGEKGLPAARERRAFDEASKRIRAALDR